MEQDIVSTENANGRVSIILYVISLLCFVPGLGVLIGIGFVVYGFTTKKRGGKIVAGVGLAGIGATVLFYVMLFRGMESGAFDPGFKLMAQSNLSQLVVNIEYYKVQNGKYPESIDALIASQPKNVMMAATAMDTSAGLVRPAKDGKLPYFYYQLVDADHYYLLGVGRDKTPFTCDDVVPAVDPKNKTGLLIKDMNCPVVEQPASNNSTTK